MSAPVTGFRAEWPPDTAAIQDPGHVSAQDEQRAILRRIEHLRCERQRLDVEISDLDRRLDDLNGGGW